MTDFTHLNSLLEFDFSQLRAENGHATLPAITQFVTAINAFFGQFKGFSQNGTVDFNPENPEEVEQIEFINSRLQLLMSRLSEAERQYYSNKNKGDKSYDSLSVSEFNDMLSGYDIKSIKALTGRMQYWAATDRFGDTIRNPKIHQVAVKLLNLWDMKYISKENNHSFFKPANSIKPISFNVERRTLNFSE